MLSDELQQKINAKFNESINSKDNHKCFCYDCEKEIDITNIPTTILGKCSRHIDGSYVMICSECGEIDY